MIYSYFGHSCFSIELLKKHILFDPFIKPNDLTKGIIDISKIKADYIFISHGHYDHLADVLEIAQNTQAVIVCIFEVQQWLHAQGYTKTLAMNVGGKLSFEFGTVKVVTAVHSSSFLDGSYAGVPVGFVFNTADKNFYYSGDTAYTVEMSLIPKYSSQIDFTVLPIGGVFTMDIDDAIEVAKTIKTKKIIGVHFDTWDFIKINKEHCKSICSKAGIEILLPCIGETIQL
ncbi:MAG: metal-dependent hydrolase [Phycisphaerales bacterium]|nr:metal-dependent hydrolase [Phycisphaerales bacterium]